MSATHFEELDWLDFAEGLLPLAEQQRLQEHLNECAACGNRLSALRRLLKAIPQLQEHLSAPSAHDVAFATDASSAAQQVLDRTAAARRELAQVRTLPPPETVPGISDYHVLAALDEARERFIDDFPRAIGLITWAEQVLQVLEAQGALNYPGLEGLVGSYRAYLRLRDGDPTGALAALDIARPFLDQAVPLRDLAVAFSSYVRAVCLHNLSRFPEALVAIQESEALYAAFGDRRYAARARLAHALIVFDAGDAPRARGMFEGLLEDPALQDDRPAFASLHLNLANNLVFVGDLARAKSMYAKAVGLLKATGQEDKLFRVRVGLADIAEREGRVADALGINLALRPELVRRHLPWDEVRRELWIIRDLLALDRYAEARSTCQRLVVRAQALHLSQEAIRALTYLADAEEALNRTAVTTVDEELTQIARGLPTRWSAA